MSLAQFCERSGISCSPSLLHISPPNFRCWFGAPSTKLGTRGHSRGKIEEDLRSTRPTNPPHAANTVFAVLGRHMDKDQLATVRNTLSKKVRRVWPEALLDVA